MHVYFPFVLGAFCHLFDKRILDWMSSGITLLLSSPPEWMVVLIMVCVYAIMTEKVMKMLLYARLI